MGIRVIGAAAAVVALAIPAAASAVQPTKTDQKNAAREEAEERQDAHANAAKECEAERAMSDEDFGAVPEHGGKTFEQFYGTNENLSNAFGKCVSTKAKA